MRAELETLGEKPSAKDEGRTSSALPSSRKSRRRRPRRFVSTCARRRAPDEAIDSRAPLPARGSADVPEGLVAARLRRSPARRRSSGQGERRATAGFGVTASPRFVRRAPRAPCRIRRHQLANALALGAPGKSRRCDGQAMPSEASYPHFLDAPESEELEPWGQLLPMGVDDAVALDDLVRRAWRACERADPRRASRARSHETKAAERRRRTDRLVLVLEVARSAVSGAFRESSTWLGEALKLDRSSVAAAILLARLRLKSAIAVSRSVPHNARRRRAWHRKSARVSSKTPPTSRPPRRTPAALQHFSNAHSMPTRTACSVAARLAQIRPNAARFRSRTCACPGRSRRDDEGSDRADGLELADVARSGSRRDPLLAIERARVLTPGVAHARAGALLARRALHRSARLAGGTLEALAGVVVSSSSPDEKLTARIGRASILARVHINAQGSGLELRAALEIDAHEPRAIRAVAQVAQRGRSRGARDAAPRDSSSPNLKARDRISSPSSSPTSDARSAMPKRPRGARRGRVDCPDHDVRAPPRSCGR